MDTQIFPLAKKSTGIVELKEYIKQHTAITEVANAASIVFRPCTVFITNSPNSSAFAELLGRTLHCNRGLKVDSEKRSDVYNVAMWLRDDPNLSYRFLALAAHLGLGQLHIPHFTLEEIRNSFGVASNRGIDGLPHIKFDEKALNLDSARRSVA